MSSPARVPEAAARAAWTHAVRNPLPPGAVPADADLTRRQVGCAGQVLAVVAIDEQPEGGRFARISLRRQGEPPLGHEEGVAYASELFVLGRFDPFPVESVLGADGLTRHYALDLERYKETRAAALREQARELLRNRSDLGADEIEVAAIQLGAPIEALLRACDPQKASARDPRTLRFLSDRFGVPEAWIRTQLGLHEAGELMDD
jgi:hypothetical protein